MVERDKLLKNQKQGLYVTIVGIVIFIIGLFAWSITESQTNDVIGVPITLVSRPYGAIGVFLMFLGFIEIIVGIISKIHYDNKLKIYDTQYSQQNPQQHFINQPEYGYCPYCDFYLNYYLNFCPNCGAEILE